MPLLTSLHSAADTRVHRVGVDAVVLTASMPWAQAPSVPTLALPAVGGTYTQARTHGHARTHHAPESVHIAVHDLHVVRLHAVELDAASRHRAIDPARA